MTSHKHAIPLNQLALFRDLPANEIQELIQGGVAVSSKHRGFLFRAGEPATSFSIVLLGAYKLFRQDLSGHESIMHFACPGDPIGAPLMMRADSVYPVSCVSIGKSMVLRIPRETYARSWVNNAVLQQRMNHILYVRMNQIQDQKVLERLPLSVKVATLLLSLLERYSNGSDRILPIPVTRQELADSVGSTVESVIRLLSEWNTQGILRLESRQIEVVNVERLIGVSRGE